MANRYFQATTDDQWDNDDGGGGGNSNWSSTTPGFTAAAKPVSGDVVVLEAACECDTDESGADLDGLTTGAFKLTITTGGTIDVKNSDITQSASGEIEMDGGTLNHIEDDAGAHYLDVYEAISSTANGGTINLSCATAEKIWMRVQANSVSIEGNAASRLKIDAGAGANPARMLYVLSRTYCTFKNLDLDGFEDGLWLQGGTGHIVDNCLMHGGTDGIYLTGDHIIVRDSWVYANANGIRAAGGWVTCFDVIFGENEVPAAAQNTTADINTTAAGAQLDLYNCKLASNTEVTGYGASIPVRVISTAHDQDENTFKDWIGIGHTVETNVAQAESDACWKIVTVAGTDATETKRCRVLVKPVPASDGDVLDITLRVKGTNTKEMTLRVDPDSICGTAKASATHTADGNWNTVTAAQYTVALGPGAGGDCAVPVYVDMEGASEDWYIETLTVTRS